jgi:hypothetical protein
MHLLDGTSTKAPLQAPSPCSLTMASMLRTLVVAVLALALGADATFFYPVYQPFIPGLYGSGFGGGSTVVVVTGHRKLLAANVTSSSSCDTAAAVLERTPELRWDRPTYPRISCHLLVDLPHFSRAQHPEVPGGRPAGAAEGGCDQHLRRGFHFVRAH